MNSLRNNNQGNNNPSDYSSRSYDHAILMAMMTVTWIMMTIIAMMIMIAATGVTAILIVTISLISNYQPNYIKPMSTAYKHSTNAMKNLSIMMLLGAFFTCVLLPVQRMTMTV